jgi:hypothetical protein
VSKTSLSVATGEVFTLSVSVSGGTAPYNYQWFEGSTILPDENSSQLAITKDTRGSYSYYCKITDKQGQTLNSDTQTIAVNSAHVTYSDLDLWVTALVVIITLVIVIMVAFLFLCRKRRRPTSADAKRRNRRTNSLVSQF